MKLSDYKGEDAIDLLADLLEPISKICTDEVLQKKVEAEEHQLKIVAYLLRSHKHEVIEIMARIDGVDPAEYKVSALTLPLKVIELLNDKEVAELFQSQGQSLTGAPFGSATETSEEIEEK